MKHRTVRNPTVIHHLSNYTWTKSGNSVELVSRMPGIMVGHGIEILDDLYQVDSIKYCPESQVEHMFVAKLAKV